LRYESDGGFPTEELARVVYASLQVRKLGRVAIICDEAALQALPKLDWEYLDPQKDYYWSGVFAQKKFGYPYRRVIVGTYEEWFRWYMRTQRFRSFHTIILIEPLAAVSDKEHGGYTDGLLARLMAKVRRVVVVAKPASELPAPDETHVKEVLRALLYGTRSSRPELVWLVSHTFASIPRDLLDKTLERYKYDWRISKEHPRFRLGELDEELVQGMVGTVPAGYVYGKPEQIEQQFKRKGRFRRELAIPDEMLAERVMEDVARRVWETVSDESKEVAGWLGELNRAEDSRLEKIFRSQEFVSDRQWLAVLNPPKRQLRRVMGGLAAEGKLETRAWFREVGRPSTAYFLPGKAPFLEDRCGQCAFFVSAKRRCRLWWLVNKKRAFFHPAWREAGSRATPFEIHKMEYASRIGPHSSACLRFVDKKRDHLRKAVPLGCEICGEGLRGTGRMVLCRNCGTKYVKRGEKVKVLTAYEHEYDRLYSEITGGDAAADYEEVRRQVRARLQDIMRSRTEEEDVDILAEDSTEVQVEPPRVRPNFDRELQEKVDRLVQTTDIARRLSIAMAKSAINATRRVTEIARVDAKEAGSAIASQEKYLAPIDNASQAQLLTYEALIMNQYWRCYRLALVRAQQWFGPRKRGRFVSEHVEEPAGRARGYTAVDAAINYLHQRRLRQAERINAEVGFKGVCDGFLHRERYNSRGIGLLLDMIDPFKFADREELLVVALNGGISWMDFRLEKDRRGLTFYYPAAKAEVILSRAGDDADHLSMKYDGGETDVTGAYRLFADDMLKLLDSRNPSKEFKPFVFAT
jgi:hypothetical protein